MNWKTTVFVLLAGGCVADAEETFPRPTWSDQPNPLVSAAAMPGGAIASYAGDYPKSFNYYLDNNTFSANLFSSMYETLLGMDPLTADYEPGLAEKWAVSDDKRTFTFWLDPRARWSDGRPVTVEDVIWTFQTIMDPQNLTGVHKVGLEKINPPVALGTQAVCFTAREVHWRNLGAVGGFHVLPKHVWAKADFNKINFEFPVVSGPYRLGEVKEGVLARLERRADWWGRACRRFQGSGNFQTITYRFYAERENAFEVFKKGGVDLYPVYTARLWANETSGERFEKNWIIKQTVHNSQPIGFQGFAMNLRRSPFDDVRVRKAMACLLDREKMNRTLMYNQYFLHRSYFEDLYDREHPCPNPLWTFDPERAQALLREAGWAVNPETGALEKGGQRLRFTFLNRDPTTDKFLTIYADDLKRAGIEMKLETKDWAAWAKDMDEFHFDMTWAAWSGGLFKDPEPMWASAEADRRGGNNITGFKDPRVDDLIEEQKAVFDLAARNAICRRIDALIAEQVPYVLLWNINYTRLLYWNKFGTPPTVLSKYGDESAALSYWWEDADSAAELQDALQSGAVLPGRPASVIFDEVFRPERRAEAAQ